METLLIVQEYLQCTDHTLMWQQCLRYELGWLDGIHDNKQIKVKNGMALVEEDQCLELPSNSQDVNPIETP